MARIHGLRDFRSASQPIERNTMKKLALAAFVLGIVGLVGGVQAEDKKAADPTGTWKYTVERNGKKSDRVLKIEAKDGKLTGTISGGKTDTKIEDGTFKDGKIAFTVTREMNGEKFVSKYSATLADDVLKGWNRTNPDESLVILALSWVTGCVLTDRSSIWVA